MNEFSRHAQEMKTDSKNSERIDVTISDKPHTKECHDNKTPLTDAQKETIEKERGYSNEIIEKISCFQEYEIYKGANLKEKDINGKKCLVRNDIDLNQKDSMGMTNKERMEKGKPPISKDGKIIELHHMSQEQGGPLVELTQEEHRGSENYRILHQIGKKTEINNYSSKVVRENHWENRYN